MDVVVKRGSKTIRKSGFSSTTVALKMEEILKSHKHLCADCCSTTCKGKRSMDSEIIVRGIRTLNRDYVFECLGYKKIKTESDKNVFVSEISKVAQPKVYDTVVYPISNEKVKEYVRRMR